MIPIGKIVKSNSHIDYVCQVYGPGERQQVPAPEDYAFGRFVRIAGERAGEADLIGVIYNTILMNPDFGTLGPRLSSAAELEIFSPDYLSEKVTVVGVLVIGAMAAGAPPAQGIPPLCAPIDAMVYPMTDAEIRRFHETAGSPALAYLALLRGQANPLLPHLTLSILEKVEGLFPETAARLAVLRQNLAWQTYIEGTR